MHFYFFTPRLLFFLVGLALLTAGCHRHDGNILARCDFESPNGCVLSDPSDISGDMAHNGQHSVKTTTGKEFIATYVCKLAAAGLPRAPRLLHLGTWVFVPDGRLRSSKLVMEVRRNTDGAFIGYAALDLPQVVKRYNKWEYVSQTVTLPADASPNDDFKFYIWRPERDGTPFYLDDFTVEACL